MTSKGVKHAPRAERLQPVGPKASDGAAPLCEDGRETAVAAYKAILQRVLDNRPSGTRLRLAGELGKNRSFVSQITNPTYPVPIPARHVDVIIEVCHLSPAEKALFLEAYGEAHPGRRTTAGRRQTRVLTLTVPDFGDARRNRAYDQLLTELAERVGRYGEGDR